MLAGTSRYFALVGRGLDEARDAHHHRAPPLAQNRAFVAVRMSITAPARVTGNFVAPDGTIVPGQTIKTPTRHAGVTILRVPSR